MPRPRTSRANLANQGAADSREPSELVTVRPKVINATETSAAIQSLGLLMKISPAGIEKPNRVRISRARMK